MAKSKPLTFKSGFISIIGKPNVGKSTLLNCLLERKIAPVSKKPQTTRQIIHGIRTDAGSQLIFVDTPGIHQPKDTLGKIMVASAKKAFGEADLVYFLTEACLPDSNDERILEAIRYYRGPVFLVLNKIDLLKDKQEMLPVIGSYQERYSFKETIPISALREIQCDVLVKKTKEYLPEGPQYFPPDMVSDQPVSEIVKEFIREKVVRFTGEEIPYVTAVVVDEMKTRENGLIEIHATIVVDKNSQKGILIGKGGSKLKQIGQAARQDLEIFFGKKIYLALWVKVMAGWKNDLNHLRKLGYQD